MKVSDLMHAHPEFDREGLADLRALFDGGRLFQARLHKFLPPNPSEPLQRYEARRAQAHYRNYFAGIVNYFSAKLFTAPLHVRSVNERGESLEADPFYSVFKEDCDGVGTDLETFLRRATADALVERRAVWVVERPSDGGVPAESLADWQARGLGNVALRRAAGDLIDWDADERGELRWAIVYDERCPRPEPKAGRREIVEHRWTIYTRETVEVWAYAHEKGLALNPEDKATLLMPPTPHGFNRVPLVVLDLGASLWMGKHIASPQLEHFRQSNALAWALRMTCYPMPVFKANGESPDPIMGAGYWVKIGAEESFAWVAPETGAFDALAESIKSQKDELFRVVHQMALGVENNAAAVGRSAESKTADSQVTAVILSSIGAVVRDAVERTYDLVTEARGEAVRWSVEGLNVFDQTESSELSTALLDAQALGIPSPTFVREAKTRLALSLLPDVSMETKTRIREEIAANVPDEPDELALPRTMPNTFEDGDE